jgi:hypothetical protein
MKYACKPDDPTRVYKPVYVLGDESIRFSEWSVEEQLVICSIRTEKTEKTTILREEIESNLIHLEEEQFIAQNGQANLENVDPVQTSNLEEYVKRNFELHKIRNIRKVLKIDKKDMYIVFVDSKFCLNMNREHKSNNVYFVATKEGVSQKCFCMCKTTEGRKFGYCKDFKSTCKPLSPLLKNVLFPDTKKKKKEMQSGSMASEWGWDTAEDFLDKLAQS